MSSSSRKLEPLVRLEVPELKDRPNDSAMGPSPEEVMDTGLADAPFAKLRGFGAL
jgi:hypothetical protein